MNQYSTRDHEAGNKIDSFETLAGAQAAIAQYVADDRRDGTYSPNFYEIYDEETGEVVEVA